MKSKILHLVICLALTAGMAAAQTPVKASPADLSIPFGAQTGHLLTVGDHLVFVSADKPENSFSVDRANLADVRIGNQTVTLRVLDPVGDRSEFTFRVADPTTLGFLANWAKQPESVSKTDETGEEPVLEVYQVRHRHSVYGGCTGRLIVTNSRISYESIDDIGHSRHWDLADVKELKRKNPYRVELKPFTGNDYDFELLQKGMSSRDYQVLADRITSQRAPR